MSLRLATRRIMLTRDFEFQCPRPIFMRNLNLIVSAAGIAVSAIFGIGAANAADLPARTYTEAPAIAPVTLYNWTGCYLGGYVGGARQSRQVNAYDPVSTAAGTTYYNPTAN
ncbi:MAG TPA: hypothetical protein VF331_27240, partial [Polyangiales bacterium]